MVINAVPRSLTIGIEGSSMPVVVEPTIDILFCRDVVPHQNPHMGVTVLLRDQIVVVHEPVTYDIHGFGRIVEPLLEVHVAHLRRPVGEQARDVHDRFVALIQLDDLLPDEVGGGQRRHGSPERMPREGDPVGPL